MPLNTNLDTLQVKISDEDCPTQKKAIPTVHVVLLQCISHNVGGHVIATYHYFKVRAFGKKRKADCLD